MPEPLVVEAPEAGALVVRQDENLPGVREGIPLRKGAVPAEEILQPFLCKPGAGEGLSGVMQKGGDGSGQK